MKLLRKLKAIKAVLSWDDAIVVRRREVTTLLMRFHPMVSGTGDTCTCQQCGAMFRDGMSGGHRDWCAAAQVEMAVRNLQPN